MNPRGLNGKGGLHMYHNRKDIPYKEFAIRAAKELGYGDDVIAIIRETDNDNEIARIMNTARKRKDAKR